MMLNSISVQGIFLSWTTLLLFVCQTSTILSVTAQVTCPDDASVKFMQIGHPSWDPRYCDWFAESPGERCHLKDYGNDAKASDVCPCACSKARIDGPALQESKAQQSHTVRESKLGKRHNNKRSSIHDATNIEPEEKSSINHIQDFASNTETISINEKGQWVTSSTISTADDLYDDDFRTSEPSVFATVKASNVYTYDDDDTYDDNISEEDDEIYEGVDDDAVILGHEPSDAQLFLGLANKHWVALSMSLLVLLGGLCGCWHYGFNRGKLHRIAQREEFYNIISKIDGISSKINGNDTPKTISLDRTSMSNSFNEDSDEEEGHNYRDHDISFNDEESFSGTGEDDPFGDTRFQDIHLEEGDII